MRPGRSATSLPAPALRIPWDPCRVTLIIDQSAPR